MAVKPHPASLCEVSRGAPSSSAHAGGYARTSLNWIGSFHREAISTLRRKDAKLITAPKAAEESVSIIAGLGIAIGPLADRDQYASGTFGKGSLDPPEFVSAIQACP